MITTCYNYDGGETEFLFSCKGRPFTAMVSSHLNTPSTLIDYNLVRDLGLKLTDPQCQRFTFGGYKLRIMGHVSTQVQTIQNGFVNGCIQFNAMVILDLNKSLDTFSVCGPTMAAKLSPTAAAAMTAGPRAAAANSPVRGSWSPPASPKPKRARPSVLSPLKTSCSLMPPVTPPRSSSSTFPASVPAAPRPPQASSSSPPKAASSLSPSTDPAAPTATEPAMTPRTPPLGPGKPRLMAPRSPPGFPTPVCMRIQSPRNEQPMCLTVKEDFPDEHPSTANLTTLDNTFMGADKLSHLQERIMLMQTFPDAKFDDIPDGEFRMETPEGLRYWSGHGEYKCTGNCYQLYGGGPRGVPNNCAWHKQWMFPANFKPCGLRCIGAFCDCLDNYDYGF